MSWLLWQSTLTNVSYAAASFALNWLVQSTVLILAGLAISRWLARHGSAVQSVVHVTTLCAVLICPLLTTLVSFSGLTHWSLAVSLPSHGRSLPVATNGTPEMTADPEMPLVRTPPNAAPRVRVPRVPNEAVLLEDEAAASDSQEAPADALAAAALKDIPSDTSEPTTGEQPAVAATASFPWLAAAAVGACAIWFAFSLVLIVRLAVAWFRLTGIRQRAIPAESATLQICRDVSLKLGVEPPQVLHTPFLPSPCLAGLWKPTVLLPESDLNPSVRDILIHELAHLRRRDGHWNLLRKLATGVFWFQPLLWVLSRKIELSAEEVCDDYVVELGGDRTDYANRLVDVAEFSAAPMAMAGVAMVSFRSMLTQRVTRILDTSRRLSTRTSGRAVMAALLLGSAATVIIGLLGAPPASNAAPPAGATAGAESSEADSPLVEAETASAVGAGSAAIGPPAERAAKGPSQRPALPGLISSPAPLPGDLRWQMYTKNPGSSAENVCWSADGRWLAMAQGQIVRMFDFQSGIPEFRLVLAGHDDTVKSVRFDAKGARLATSSLDGTVRLWDIGGRELFVYRGHEAGVQDVSWHPDGDRLASAGLDGTVRIWTVDGQTSAVITDHEAPVNAVAWNPTGLLLASGCENRTIRYWNVDGSPLLVTEGHIGPVRSLAWNQEGSLLASCDFGIEASDNQQEDMAHIKVWDMNGQPVSSMLINQPLHSVSWSPDGGRIVAGSWRGFKLWKIDDPQASSKFYTNLNGFIPAAWRPNGDLIAGGPMLCDAEGNPQPLLTLRTASYYSAGLNRDGTVLGVGRANRVFELYDSDGQQTFSSPPQPGNAYSLTCAMTWNPEGTQFIPGVRYHRELQRFDVQGQPVGTAVALPGDTRSVAWSNDGRYAAAGGDQQVITLIDWETNQVVTLGKQGHGVTQVRFTPNQQQVCSAGFDGCIRFWSLDGKPLQVFEAISAPICSLAWAAGGELLASGHQDNAIRLWSGSGDLLTVIGGHGGHVESLEFSPDGSLLASGSRDHSIRIWKRDGTPVAVLQGHSGTVYGVQWTPDGRGLYSAAADGTIRCWNVETGIALWQVLQGDAGGYVTIDSEGRVKHGDERVLESEFVFFAEDEQRQLARIGWDEIRPVLQRVAAAANGKSTTVP